MAMKNAGGKVTQAQEIPAVEEGVTVVLHEQMIAVAAYYQAEHRGFVPGQELEDWLQAEKEFVAGGGSGA